MDDDTRVHEAKNDIIQAVVALYEINPSLLHPHVAEEVEMLLREVDEAEIAARSEKILNYLRTEG